MSLASDYAAAQAAIVEPDPFIMPRVHAKVTPDGQCHLVVDGSITMDVPPEALTAFAAWVQATFS